MISEKTARDAAFWGAEWVCLTCGTVFDEGEAGEGQEPCCHHQRLIDPQIIVAVLDGVVREDDQPF